jgi:hypothetical protein
MEGRELNNPKAMIHECGVREDAVLLLRRKVIVAGRSVVSLQVSQSSSTHVKRRTAEQDAEMMRLQILGDPRLMEEIRNASSAAAHYG